MPPGRDRRADGEEGTAAVELVAVLPFLLLVLLVAAQIPLAGLTFWSASVAARAGARAALVGRDPARASRAVVPAAMRRGSRVESRGPGVSVRLPVPGIVPGLPPIEAEAGSSLEAGGG